MDRSVMNMAADRTIRLVLPRKRANRALKVGEVVRPFLEFPLRALRQP